MKPTTTQKTKISYEVRYAHNITSSCQSGTIFKKGKLHNRFSSSESLIRALTNHPCVCEGHGVYHYFNAKKDFTVFKVINKITTKTTEYKMKITGL